MLTPRRLFLLLLVSCGLTLSVRNAESSLDVSADDWPTASPESLGLSAVSLQAMETAVRSGQFQKITSVLVARHGKLAYEAYFNGFDANSLMDTRSATKTVTSMLVGVALDKKLLVGVDARVFPMFADEQPIQSLDPARKKSP